MSCYKQEILKESPWENLSLRPFQTSIVLSSQIMLCAIEWEREWTDQESTTVLHCCHAEKAGLVEAGIGMVSSTNSNLLFKRSVIFMDMNHEWQSDPVSTGDTRTNDGFLCGWKKYGLETNSSSLGVTRNWFVATESNEKQSEGRKF